MNNEINVKETILELDKVSSMYNRYLELNEALNNLDNEKNEEEDNLLKETTDKLISFKEEQDKKFDAKRPSANLECLKMPPKPPVHPDASNPVRDILIGALSVFLMIFSVAFWLILIIINPGNEATGLVVFSVLLMLSSIGFWAVKGNIMLLEFIEWAEENEKWKIEQNEWEKNFNNHATKQEMQRFLTEFKKYDACFLHLVDICTKKYDEENKLYLDNCLIISKKYIDKIDQIADEMRDISKQFENITIIHSDLFHNAWRISSMLKTGRAETLKEAINLAIDEERKDNEEAARRAEAYEQKKILEQQAYDNYMHNEEMARVAAEEARAMKAHNEAMEKNAKVQAEAAMAQAKEAARQTELAQKQAREAQRAASARCASCVNHLKCSYDVKQNAGSCGAYRPR